MVPTPLEYNPDFWKDNKHEIQLSCLLPNGIFVLLQCHDEDTLADIKEDLWEEAAKYPLYGKLHDVSIYKFMCINHMSEREHLTDETKKIRDIKPQACVLIITEYKDSAEDVLNTQIGHIIGKRLHEFDELSSSEVNDFRFKMRKVAEDIAIDSHHQSWEERLMYQFPPRLDKTSLIYKDILHSMKNINIASKIAVEHSEVSEKYQSSHTFSVSPLIVPYRLLEMILAKKAIILKDKNDKADNYVLKVCGQDEYFVGDYPIVQFQYIQDSLSREIIPMLVMVSKDSVPLIKLNNPSFEINENKPKPSYSTLTLRKKGKYKSSLNIEEPFRCTLYTVSRLNCDPKKVSEVGIQVGLFHGGKSLCQPQKTDDRQINESFETTFHQELVFDIDVCNIPRNAKLCFVVYEVNKYSKGTKNRKIKESAKDNPIAWANTTVYDFKNQLRTGSMTLYFWNFAEDMMSDEGFQPLGTVVSNPNTGYATSLTLSFYTYSEDSQFIFVPSDSNSNYEKIDINPIVPNAIDIENCKKILQEIDNSCEIHEQDRKNIWYMREYWLQNHPEVLPKLLMCIDWDKREEVFEVSSLLQKWPLLPVEKSLELLDYAYADPEVRSFAVKCLKDVSDEDLLLYLLQLVQAIKHELFLESDLTKFLIQRALNNQKIGHYIFWHLRSEMQVAAVSVRFGLMLEAYCRGRPEHIPVLQKQLEAHEKFKKATEIVRARKDKEKAKAVLREYLSESDTMKTMSDLRSPLDPTFRCSKIRVEKCKFMDSKMRPLWIVFENCDKYGEDVYVIFKNGDDLRQDMLTLQMLRIMDRLWKQEGLDLRMNAYNCISMEHRVGMIQVVLNAETIANIQKEKGIFSATTAFKKGPILDWLRDNNSTESELNKAVNEFTLSCAGYCVATYVLGIADRHSDNIMVKKSGQLFHIDFGHILGHFKEKFGFKRERVPFVLTHDFVNVINKGQKNASEFHKFQEYCEKAFMILRKHGNLILSLCAMMISTGLPELSSEKDLNYLRETLVLSKTDEEALSHFKLKFDEALTNSWKTSINWATHNIAKNNKA
ncbi:unnamed protein product [Brassicogethes aeneus]|uniref:phosphatidylinositol 3-kinase n=1 Tax=Brassicogethes aeneus TaxID=1431903 RepID=A0A9P0B4K2_BRAAE|nr:unnamed protein product [Brassicogethes aeneus]